MTAFIAPTSSTGKFLPGSLPGQGTVRTLRLFALVGVACLAMAASAVEDATKSLVNPAYNGNGGDLFIGNYESGEAVHSTTDENRIRHRELIARGLLEAREEKITDALKSFQAALAAEPESVVAMVAIAELCLSDDPARAKRYLEQASRIDPDYYRLHFVEAKFQRRMGTPDGMLAALDKCLELKESHIDARQMRAEELVRRTDSKEAQRRAIEDFHVLQQILPQRSPVWNFLIGRCYFNLEDYRNAVKYLEFVVGIPGVPEASYYLGRAKQELGEYDEAVEHLSRAKLPLAKENIAQIALLQAESATGEVRLRYMAQALNELKGLLSTTQFANQPQKLLTAGKLANQLGQHDVAINYLRRYLEKVPDDKEVREILLDSLLGTFDVAELTSVRQMFDEIVAGRSAEDSVPLRFKYAGYLMALMQWDEAWAEVEEIEGILPNDGRPPFLKAGIAIQSGSFEEAVEEGNKSLALSPERRDEIQVLLGNAYLSSGSEELAALAFEDAVRSASDRFRALRCLEIGEFYRNREMNAEGIRYWEMALAEKPDNEVLRYEIGRAYLQSGSLEQAIPYFESVAENSKMVENKSRATTLLAYISAVNGATETAEKQYRTAVEVWPSNHYAHSGLAHLLADQERYAEAKESFESAVALYDEDVSLIIQLGIICDKLDDIEGAERAAAKAMEVDPEYAEAYNFLGYLYAERAIKLDRALELVQKAMELQPDDPNITDSLGWVYYQMEDYEKAVEVLEKSVSLITDADRVGAAVIYEHLGDAYEKTRRFDEAMAMWRKAIEGTPQSETAAAKIQSLSEKRQTTGKASRTEPVGTTGQ